MKSKKILDNVNPDDLMEPEVKKHKKGKKRKPKSKENDYSDLEIKRNNSSFNKRQIMSRMWFFDERVKANDLDDCSNDYLEYVFDQMCDNFKKSETVHLDETPLQIIEDCKDGRKKGICVDGNERNIRNHSDGAVLQSRKSEIRKCDDDSWRRQSSHSSQ